jgi:hypothetical protein
LISGIDDHRVALCLEWAIKHVRGVGTGLTGRVNALKTLMQRDFWTSTCPSIPIEIDCRGDLVSNFTGLKWVKRAGERMEGFLDMIDADVSVEKEEE